MATLFLARRLASSGRRVVLAANMAGGDDILDGVELWNIGPEYDVGSALRRISLDGGYHLISAGRALPLLMARDDSNCLSSSLITHDRTSGDSGISAQVLEQLADTIFCVSNAQRELFIKDGVAAEKLEVIHNGVDLDLFSPGEPAARDLKRLIFVGAVIVDKGIHILIESIAKLMRRHPGLKLDIYGSSSLWGREEFLNHREIEQALPGVKFHGKVSQSEIAKAMRGAAACVIPSIWFDPFPLVSIDAQAAGCPVVAFDVGGLREGILVGETGLVVPEISEEALTAALDSLLSDPQRLVKMSEMCVQSRGRFTWDNVVEKITGRCERGKNGTGLQTIAIMTTWNQTCGLATYAKYLVQAARGREIVVLGEHCKEPTSPDEPFVERCWERDSTDFSKLKQVISQRRIKALYINCQYRFFPQPQFAHFLNSLRAEGVSVICHLHSTFTVDERLGSLMGCVDGVIVHTPENRLEAIANGASAEKVFVVPHAVFESPYRGQDKSKLRADLKLPLDRHIISSFGFVQPHKGIEGLIEAIAHLLARGVPVQGYVLGTAAPGDPGSAQYSQSLRELSRELGVEQFVTFQDRFLSDDEVARYLSASDVVLMNYRSQHFEASGAGALALGSGALVVTSLAPPFQPYGDAVWHLSSGYPLPIALELLLSNDKLRDSITANAASYMRRNSWSTAGQKIFSIVDTITKLKNECREEAAFMNNSRNSGARTGGGSLRVLMQNRNNAFSQRGGDTVLMEETKSRLEKLGAQVTIDVEAKEDPARYDVVHLFNFALPQMVRALAEQAASKGVPVVVTTLCEDIASFHNQSIETARKLIEYVQRGQDRSWYQTNLPDISAVQPCDGFDNRWVAEHADCLIANGESEVAVLKKAYPSLKKVQVVPVGYEIPGSATADKFVSEYGLQDFIFCVGRLETRKNQLMLLKALEDVDIPVVLAGGGFSYQPDYEKAVRSFRRKGKTLVLDRISPEMLASAYCACKVHVLPSWFELPGLVSLEAAFYERNVVVTRAGTAPDYFGDKAFYCDPGSESSILQAVLAAYYSPLKAGLKEVAMKHSWDEAARKTLEVYQSAAGTAHEGTQRPEAAPAVYDFGSGVTEFQELLERGELAAKSKDFEKAHDFLAKAERINPQSARLLRARGAVYLAQGQVELARQYFERGVLVDPSNAKLQSGLGMCAMQRNDYEDAYRLFSKALEISPNDLVAILQLIECSYTINKYDKLEAVLRRYVSEHSGDIEMKYCLAGCLYKCGQFGEAERIAEDVLAQRPDHLGAKQLVSAISEGKQTREAVSPQPVIPAAQQAPQTQQIGFSALDASDEKLIEIEELKRKKEYSKVRGMCETFLGNSGLLEHQRERAELVLAEVKVLQGEIADAERSYDEILGRNARCARALCGKGAISANRNEWEKAREFFESANKLEPHYDVPWAGLGVCNYWANDFEGAWNCFSAASRINPENVRALLGIIELGYSMKRLKEVEAAIKGYLEMHPVDLEFIYSLAGCYFAQDKLDEAISEVNKITLFDPANARAQELREMIDQKRGVPSVSGAGAR
ncbi:MAG: glycosyltransferase [Deltaproteobacteria bacterium]|nr:glycosyltransferase [Deltaproteobacteria bacterium]